MILDGTLLSVDRIPALAGHRRAVAEVGARDRATDPAQAARLWELSARITGLDAFAVPTA